MKMAGGRIPMLSPAIPACGQAHIEPPIEPHGEVREPAGVAAVLAESRRCAERMIWKKRRQGMGRKRTFRVPL